MKTFSKYTLVAVIALFFDILIMSIHYHFDNSSAIISAAIGYLSGAIISYLLSITYVFNHRVLKDKQHIESSLYILIGLLGLLITEVIIFITMDKFQLPLLMAKAIAVVVSFLVTYLIRHNTLFLKKHIKLDL
jgi:putative flippase GtrA